MNGKKHIFVKEYEKLCKHTSDSWKQCKTSQYYTQICNNTGHIHFVAILIFPKFM